jgi:hypothetical protein
MLIHGDRDFGQIIMARRILTAWGLGAVQPIPIDLARLQPSPMDALASELGRALGLEPKRANLQSVVTVIAKRLRFNHVVLQATLGLATTATLVEEFMKQFWEPLVEAANVTASGDGSNTLLLLLMDDCSRQDGWPTFGVVDEVTLWNSAIPVNLPRLQKIPKEVISAWLASDATDILKLLPFDLVAERLYAHGSEGIPEHVFDVFCWLYSTRWQKEKQTCLTTE